MACAEAYKGVQLPQAALKKRQGEQIVTSSSAWRAARQGASCEALSSSDGLHEPLQSLTRIFFFCVELFPLW